MMHLPMELLAGFIGLNLTIVGWIWRRLVSTLDRNADSLGAIERHLSVMNGRIGKMETWQQMHEEYDDERHEEARRDSRNLWEAVKESRRS